LQPPGVLRHRPTNRKAPAPAASAVRYPQSRTQRALATSKERCSRFWPAP
ncbi:uncharacterized protein B0T23DRAFT_308546, partial [Neurospora hispaniola]